MNITQEETKTYDKIVSRKNIPLDDLQHDGRTSLKRSAKSHNSRNECKKIKEKRLTNGFLSWHISTL